MSKTSRVTFEQRQQMIEYMMAHEDLASGRVAGADASRRKSEMLGEFATILNAMKGGATKSPEKWWKSWQDWRSDTKAKALRLKKYRGGTGGGPSPAPLSQLEETLLQFCRIKNVQGIQGIALPLEWNKWEIKSPNRHHWGRTKLFFPLVPTGDDRETTKRIEEQISNTSDEIKNTSQILVQEINSQSHAQDRQASRVTVTIEDESADDPLLAVEQETHWFTQDDTHSGDSDMDNYSFSSSTKNESLEHTAPPSEPEFPVNSNFELKHKLTERSIERAEVIHKLIVAEKIWALKIMRERHATARLERERAQIERDKARLERDHAQLSRNKAQLELDRAKRNET